MDVSHHTCFPEQWTISLSIVIRVKSECTTSRQTDRPIEEPIQWDRKGKQTWDLLIQHLSVRIDSTFCDYQTLPTLKSIL